MASILSIFWSTEPALAHLRTRLLLQVIFVEIAYEKKWEQVKHLGPSIPPLTAKQCKLFSLLCLIESEKSYSDIIDKFIDYLEYKIFGKNGLKIGYATYHVYQLANLSRIFLTLCKYKGEF